jgi:hypothetical protein
MLNHILKICVVILTFFNSQLIAQDIADCHKTCCEDLMTRNSTADQFVYICMGPYSKAYHSSNNCPGLTNCSVKPVSMVLESQAQLNYGRRPCCRCWSNVFGNCSDDYTGSSGSGGGGGGDSEALGIAVIAVAAVIVVTGVALISNEIQISPAWSFENMKSYGGIGKGCQIQFRKTFRSSALEYGITTFVHPYQMQLGGHFSYVHHIFDSKMPTENLKIFVGPTLKITNNPGVVGLGGILGSSYRLLDWLHADFRYELTNQSNQIQLGLRFRYQKEYFWKKKKLF